MSRSLRAGVQARAGTSTRVETIILFVLRNNCGDKSPFLWCHWYLCFWTSVESSPMGIKARVDIPSPVPPCSIAWNDAQSQLWPGWGLEPATSPMPSENTSNTLRWPKSLSPYLGTKESEIFLSLIESIDNKTRKIEPVDIIENSSS